MLLFYAAYVLRPAVRLSRVAGTFLRTAKDPFKLILFVPLSERTILFVRPSIRPKDLWGWE